MASIGSLSSSTSSLVSGGGGLKGYGGLASGLDRDTLIESMTYATRARIAKQQQKKQTYQWKQEAYRSVTDKLVALSSKYMDYTNPTTNLSASGLFDRTNIVANGKNASKVSVTASGSNAADSLTILGVKQMAKNASATSSSAVSDATLSTGDVRNDKVNNFYNENIKIEYGGKTYTVQFGEVSSENLATAKDQLNAALKKVKIDGSEKTLDQVVSFENAGNGLTLKAKEDVKITGGSEVTLKTLLGPQASADLGKYLEEHPDALEIKQGRSLGNITATKDSLFREESFADRVAGKTLEFNYNGQSISIQMPSQEELTKVSTDEEKIGLVQKALQNGFDKAIGKDRVEVGYSNGKFSFKTILPGNKKDDTTSVLTLTGGSAGMVGGNGAFRALAGENNKLNLYAKIGKSGLSGTGDISTSEIQEEDLSLWINGKQIKFTSESSINDIMNKINESDAGVRISYLQNSDKFTITSTIDGASGNITFGKPADSAEADHGKDITATLFGTYDAVTGKYGKMNIENGRDAIVTVQYAGSSEQINLVRGSNSFIQDGLNITLKGTFGEYDATDDAVDKDGKILDLSKLKINTDNNAGNEITFESKANTDSLLTTIKDMVAAYNEIVDLVNGLASTKPDRDYAPLTDEQKEEMTEEQIEKWEKKAKEGILFGDDLMRGLSSDLRFVISGSFVGELSQIGITEANGYSSNGKLVIDENKLKNALESEPDKVAKLFTDKDNGLMSNMKKVTDSYAKTWGTKGSLIQRAGSESAAVSLTDNELYKSMKDIDDIIKQLQTRLKSEQDRYIAQFTRLETAIAQMNSQSSYLSSMSGGY